MLFIVKYLFKTSKLAVVPDLLAETTAAAGLNAKAEAPETEAKVEEVVETKAEAVEGVKEEVKEEASAEEKTEE